MQRSATCLCIKAVQGSSSCSWGRVCGGSLLGFSVPPSRGLTALVLYWAGAGPPEPRSLSALSLETQKQANRRLDSPVPSWSWWRGKGGKRPREHVGLVQGHTDKHVKVTISEVENLGLSEQEKAPASWLQGTPRGEATCPN